MKSQRFSIPKLAICIAIPLILGAAVGLLTKGSMDVYAEIAKPPFSPPAIVFPIVWSILYIIMGISLYLISEAGAELRQYYIFAIQLALNLLWPFLFFSLQAFTAAFVCLVAMWIAILLMIISFFKVSKPASLIQIPYLCWVAFAGILNYAVMVMN